MATSLISKLAKVMAEISRIEKRGHNEYHNYDYAMEADFLDAVRSKLAEQSIFIFTRIRSAKREIFKAGFMCDVELEHTICDGDSDATIIVNSMGTGTDTQDKALYKAITGAMKYFIAKNFLVSTGDDPERDHDLQGPDLSLKPTEPGKTKPVSAPKGKPPVKASEEAKEEKQEEKKAHAVHTEMYSKWLDQMRSEKKRMGDGMYYSILKGFGMEHANQTPPDDALLMNAIFWQMKSMVADDMYKEAPQKAEEAMKKLVERDRG